MWTVNTEIDGRIPSTSEMVQLVLDRLTRVLCDTPFEYKSSSRWTWSKGGVDVYKHGDVIVGVFNGGESIALNMATSKVSGTLSAANMRNAQIISSFTNEAAAATWGGVRGGHTTWWRWESNEEHQW